jgi:hypothetical protein
MGALFAVLLAVNVAYTIFALGCLLVVLFRR